MPVKSVIEDYMLRALPRTQYERLQDGSVTAWHPDFPGLIALGKNGKDCYLDFWRRLDKWVWTSLEERLQLPVIDGIDLNTEENRRLAAYHQKAGGREQGEFFETEEDFLAALEE